VSWASDIDDMVRVRSAIPLTMITDFIRGDVIESASSRLVLENIMAFFSQTDRKAAHYGAAKPVVPAKISPNVAHSVPDMA